MSQAGLLTYSRFMSFPFRPTKQWMQYVMKRIKEFTAAGLSGTLTPFPFHPAARGLAGNHRSLCVRRNADRFKTESDLIGPGGGSVV